MGEGIEGETVTEEVCGDLGTEKDVVSNASNIASSSMVEIRKIVQGLKVGESIETVVGKTTWPAKRSRERGAD